MTLASNRAATCVALLCVGIASTASAAFDTDDVTTIRKPAKVAVLKIGGPFGEDPVPQSPIGPSPKNFGTLVAKIRKLAADPDIDGVELEVKGGPDFARTLDLLREMDGLKRAGKKVTCYAETMGQGDLMFSTIADLLALPPSGQIQLTGIMAEIMYMKDLFALLDVKMHVVHIGEYKSAYENYAKDHMSDENRTVLTLLMEEYYDQLLRLIGDHREMSRDQVEVLFDQLLVEPEDALRSGLIDLVAYRDQYEAQRERLYGREVELIKDYGDTGKEELEALLNNPFSIMTSFSKLLNPPKKKLPKKPRIAIVYATGAITSGKSSTGLDGTVSSMGSDTLVKALDEVAKDDWVKGVILRVNSPGGSALASDMIWRATQRVRERKPIVSSMGHMAASGGYWISMGCDRIIAQPSTLTGSIGVVGMLPDVSQTLRRFGVNVEVVGKGPRVDDLAMMRDGPSEFLKGRIKTSMEKVYGEFIRKVAEGRHMAPQIVESLARGRVWTGRQAVDLNLVDRLGGIDEAIAVVCELAGLDPATVPIAEYPEPPNFMETLEDALDGMVTIEGQVKQLLVDAGYGDLVQLFDHLGKGMGVVHSDTIQAVLPFAMSIR